MARRHRAPRPPAHSRPDERATALETLHADRFVDTAPAEVVATLLDEGTYLASERTIYRVLAAHDEVRERRAQLRHPAYAAPELLATASQRAVVVGHHRTARARPSGRATSCT